MLIDCGSRRPRPIDEGRQEMTRMQEEAFGACLRGFSKDVGRFPTESEGLDALFRQPDNLQGWRGPYINKLVLDDLWGRPYIYRVDAPDRATVISLGSDGVPGGVGFAADIVVTVDRDATHK
jgi:general secretion pathway protein G